MSVRTPTSSPSAVKSKRKRIKINKTNTAIVVWFLIFFIGMSAISINVFTLTVLGIHSRSNTDMAAIASQVHIRETTLQANRGQILDRNGYVIAEDVSSYRIIAYLSPTRLGINNQPAFVVDPQATANALAPILNTDEATLYQLLTRNLFQTELGTAGRNLTLSQRQAIEALNLPGITFERSHSRNYPAGVFASHLIGFAQYDHSVAMINGLAGLEQALNPFLRGINGLVRFQSDAAGFIFKDMLFEETPPVHGANVVTTIDREIQEALELSLDQTMLEHNADTAFAMVMHIQTAEIIAYGHRPTFDPNRLNITNFLDLNAQSLIEPGSVMKTLLWAAAIENGVYDSEYLMPSSIFHMGISQGLPTRLPNSEGSFAFIRNFNQVDHGLVNFDRSFDLSLNTSVGILLTQFLTPAAFISTLDALSLFNNLNVFGLRSVDGRQVSRFPIEMLTLGFGQGSTVVPLNMLSAYQALLNDGQHIQPSVIRHIADPQSGQVVYQHDPQVLEKVFSASTTQTMIELLRSAVVNGTGKNYQIEEVNIIGKTGTSQLPGEDGRYRDDKFLYSFVAALPYENPQYLVYYGFTAENITGAHRKVEAQRALLRKIAITMNLSVDQSSTQTTVIHVPSFVNQSVDRFRQFALANKLRVLVIGEGNSISHLSIAPNSAVLSNALVFAQTNAPLITMPDVIGLSVSEVQHLARFTGLDIEIQGEGYIVAANIAINAPIDQKIILQAERP